jgi:hypothetical protein
MNQKALQNPPDKRHKLYINKAFMTHQKPLRETISFKQNEKHIMDSRDNLCKHYRLNKSDLIKYLIRKEEHFLKKPSGDLIFR